MPVSVNRRKNMNTSFTVKNFMLFVGPIFLIYTFSFVVPLLGGIYYSFTDWSGIFGTEIWNGLDNYKKLFHDIKFYDSLKRTMTFVFWNCLFTNILAMLFAVVLSRKSLKNDTSQMMLFMPNVISLVVTGFIWQFLLSRVAIQTYDMTGLSFFGINFLGDPRIVIYSCVLVSLWAGIGYIMVIYIAALQGVDQSHIEAAIVDGCGSWKLFWMVKLPEIMPIVSVGIFINISGSIKVYDLIFALTQGGPGVASELVMLNIYNEAFHKQNAGYADTKAMFVTVFIMILTLLQIRLTREKEIK